MDQEARKKVTLIGIALVLGSLALFGWEFRRGQQLQNYKRIALFLPVAYSMLLLHVDTFADWSNAPATARIRAGGAVAVTGVLTLGAFAWWVLGS